MSVFPQMLLDLHHELIVDLFAGGGGASTGIEMATGRQVDIAINHDAAAVSLHQANHPQTRHHVSDVFEVDPREVTEGRPVGLLWASPDCTFHSKARGGKPFRDGAKKRRALAWVVTRWAGQVRPRVIMLENVEEFADWGPLVGPPGAQRPCRRRAGRTFRKWIRSLERLGYAVEWRELRACDYGAPTIRKRLFVIARCDGEPIVWPAATHGPGTRRKYRSAAECIDWSIPMLSIFATKDEAKDWAAVQREAGRKVGTPVRPLADATMRRIARGVMKYVVESPKPFVVGVGGRQGRSAERPLDRPMQTVPNNTNNAAHSPLAPLPTVTGGGRNILAAPVLAQTGYGERKGQAPRSLDIQAPLGTVVGGGQKHALVSAFLAKHFTGVDGAPLTQPAPTVTTIDHNGLVAASLAKLRGTSTAADPADPLHTISAGGEHHAAVAAFLAKYYGQGDGAAASDPAPTVTTKDRFGLVTVEVQGEPYVIADIAMRMLQPRELYRAQGFPDSYRIDRGADGRKLTKTEQVRMVGNSVSPVHPMTLVRANLPELIVRDEAAA